MNARKSLKPVKPQAAAGVLPCQSPPLPSGSSRNISCPNVPDPSSLPAREQAAAKIWEDIRRRYETPFKISRSGGGQNH